MEKTVMVLNVENSVIKVKDSLGGEKDLSKATLLVTDGNDRFVAEAFDKVAEGIAAGNLKGKLCNIVCQLQTRKWEREGRCGISTTIKVVCIKGLFDTMDEYLDEEKKNDANSTNQQ